jgi:hypothetical protein
MKGTTVLFEIDGPAANASIEERGRLPGQSDYWLWKWRRFRETIVLGLHKLDWGH